MYLHYINTILFFSTSFSAHKYSVRVHQDNYVVCRTYKLHTSYIAHGWLYTIPTECIQSTAKQPHYNTLCAQCSYSRYYVHDTPIYVIILYRFHSTLWIFFHLFFFFCIFHFHFKIFHFFF